MRLRVFGLGASAHALAPVIVAATVVASVCKAVVVAAHDSVSRSNDTAPIEHEASQRPSIPSGGAWDYPLSTATEAPTTFSAYDHSSTLPRLLLYHVAYMSFL
ncbi:hypothetical protein EJ04DRAFT_510230 [Polyplosphaeria fusca]|uniref:Secreted peptide n=1 Tax=Polyplosphaeria fusca TaxID=682080 RepID=A0A9P4R3S3_9PLEO|nr:hypothetical protein EJ04DRAFT_510230 [Polyplosphaeria fusca]